MLNIHSQKENRHVQHTETSQMLSVIENLACRWFLILASTTRFGFLFVLNIDTGDGLQASFTKAVTIVDLFAK